MPLEINVIGGHLPEELEIDNYQPPLPKSSVQIPLRQLRGEAFYAAATMPPEEFEQTFQDVTEGLSRHGSHPRLDKIKQDGAQKKQRKILDNLTNLASNPEVAPLDKVTITQDLIREAQQEPSAKEVYLGSLLEEKAPLEVGVIGGVEADLYDFEQKFKEQEQSLLDWTQAIGGVGSALVMSIPAGVLGVYHLIKERDSAAAAEVVQLISQAGYMPEGQGAREVMALIAKKAEVLEIPARWIGDLVFDNTDNNALAATAAYTLLDPLNFIPIGVVLGGRQAMKSYVKAKFPDHSYAREEPYLPTPVKSGETVFFDTRNPIGEVSKISREEAAKLGAYAVKSDDLAKAGGTSTYDILNAYVLPKIDPSLQRVFPDIYEKLIQTDRKFINQFDASKVSPFLFDVSAIGRNVDKHFEIMDQVSGVYPMMASSTFENVGRSFRGNILFGQKPNKGFVSPEEAIDAMQDLTKLVKEKYKGSDVKPKFTVKEMDSLAEGKEYFIAWDFHRMFDPNVDTSLGIGAKLGPFDVTNLANTKFGQWFFSPATRLPTWTTAGPARATINQTKLEKVWNDTLRNEILSVNPRQQLAQAIYETEARGVDLTVSDLIDMNRGLSSKDFKALVNGYFHYRRLVDHMYATMNDIYRTQKVTTGYYGLYDAEGNYIGNLGKAVGKEDSKLDMAEGEVIPGERKPLIGDNGDVAISVYDFTKMPKEDVATGKMVQEAIGEQPVSALKSDTVVYKLDKPYTVDGKVFEFAVGLKEGAVPRDLLPKIPGYYPHINKEHYFIKAIPKQLALNGRDIPNTPANKDIYYNSATTVNVARREKDANKLVAALSKESKEFDYVPSVEKLDVDDTLRTQLDMVKYAQDVSKSRKEDRLTLPDGSLGRLEDPAVALEKRLNEAARLLAWKDQDFIFRQRFTEKYSKLFKGGEFPKSVADLELPGGGKVNDPSDIALQKEAIVNFEQYARQQTTKATLLEPLWKSSALKLGRLMEEVSPKWLDKWVEDFPGKVKDAAKWRDPVINNLVKLTTFKYIHLHPLRQWLVQPAQLYELHALALTNGNTLFTRDMVNLSHKLMASIVFENSSLVPDAIRTFFKESAHVNTPYSKAEMTEILDAFKQSGIPYSIDMNAIVDGVFKSASQGLDVSQSRHLLDQAIAATRGAIHTPKQVGFNMGELMNNIGLWLYARSEFIKNNPGKKWNDPHNLEQIAVKSWGVGNQMLTRADLLPYQEGSLRLLMQFASYSSKAAFQPLNSKFLTKGEKQRLAAIRLAAFGMDGIVFGPLLLNKIRKRYHEETAEQAPSELEDQGMVEELFYLADRGLTDAIVNGTLRMFFDDDFGAKTDLLVSKDLAPVGGSDIGLPIADLMFDMWQVAEDLGEVGDKFAFAQATSSLFKTYDDIRMVFKAREYEKMDIPQLVNYINKTTEFASGASSFERGLAMLQHKSIVSKMGNPLNLETTTAEAYARMLSVQSVKENAYYEIVHNSQKLKKEIQDTAKKIVGYLDTVEDVYDPRKKEYANLSLEEKIDFRAEKYDRINWLMSIYDENHLGVELQDAVRKQLDQQEKAGIITAIQRMQNRNDLEHFDPHRRRMFEIMKQLKASGNEKLVNQIDRIFIDAGTPLKDKDKPAMEKE